MSVMCDKTKRDCDGCMDCQATYQLKEERSGVDIDTVKQFQALVESQAQAKRAYDELDYEEAQIGICGLFDKIQLTKDALPLFREWVEYIGLDPKDAIIKHNRRDESTTIQVMIYGVRVFIYDDGLFDVYGEEL